MRDSILRIVDDLETKQTEGREVGIKHPNTGYYAGLDAALAYAIKELKKVIADYPDSNRV